ncbi:hypothetical protein [Piscinibacter koreensis]|uniref:Uncharacterized protein n=1 Tax=Piscinibacter koreensis TaxID=2742824 RepID=A0A7Y6NP23_9BURK|nr:hypothetical protein [Schlegelella koreensis]NUZ06743.1 hypothetical protein [Schlegelella koreensis]
MASFDALKAVVIDVIDDFTKHDVALNYDPKGSRSYNAKVKLAKLYINEPVLAVMPIRFNKAMRTLVGSKWRDVGSLDLVALATIGEVIALACAHSGIELPAGEPK